MTVDRTQKAQQVQSGEDCAEKQLVRDGLPSSHNNLESTEVDAEVNLMVR
jgi:hypothetical protein